MLKKSTQQSIKMSLVELKSLLNDDLKKRLASQIDIEDWRDECSKCGYPRLLHKELHREAACTKDQELPNILKENWKEYQKRVKPILKILKEEFKKEIEQGILLNGLTKLISSNTKNMTSLVTSFKDSFKKEVVSFGSSTTEAGVNRVSKLTKPAKVPSWTKDMSLETYAKQIMTWTGINEDVPEYVKFHDLMEELKKKKDIKGLLKYVTEHVIPVLVRKTDQTLDKVIELLDMKYGISRTEKVEDVIEDYLKFREDQYEDDDELILAMKEL